MRKGAKLLEKKLGKRLIKVERDLGRQVCKLINMNQNGGHWR